MAHTCHAHGCQRRIAAKLFMCSPHWFTLEERLRQAIWREYRPGQEIDKDPSNRYLAVQQYAIGSLAFKPHDEAAALAAAPYLLRSVLYRHACVRAGQGDPLPWVALPPVPVEGTT